MTTGRDRLRELLDAVLDEDNPRLDDMAEDAYASPHHFARQLAEHAGEPPVSLRRRVMLERAAWRLGRGASVTEVAFEAGYDSVDGFARAFSRAFGHPPSATTAGSGHRLPAPNGVHFHPPTSLWVEATAPVQPGAELIATLVHHDVVDTRQLIERAAALSADELTRPRLAGLVVLDWDGPEESIAAVLEHTIWTKEVWLASIEGEDFPERGADDPASLLARHDAVAARWIALVRDTERHGRWGDRIIDALCEPPESFLLGGIIAHVLTFAAHRRQLVRTMLRDAGVEVDSGDPLAWLSERGSS